MPQFTTILLVALVTLLWIGVVTGVWALLSVGEEYPPEVSKAPTKE
jgi:hypothetical protein